MPIFQIIGGKKVLNFKEEIAKKISDATDLNNKEVEDIIEIPKEKNMGDYALPCFKFAKTLRKAPQMIANEINEKMQIDDGIIEKKEVVGRILKFLHK